MELILSENLYFTNYGYCPCCEQAVKFIAKDSWLRDSYVCSICNSIPRERALIYWLNIFFPAWKDLKIHECSPVFRGASLKLRTDCKDYLPTYFFPNQEDGAIVDGFLNINLEKQNFQDQLFDLVVTQDVFEHLYNPSNAFLEISRTLKKGGAHIFTVPMVNKATETQQWSQMNADGTIAFLYEKEYHGDPVNETGSPVAWHWGFDICQFIQRTTGMSSIILLKEDLSLGLKAEYLEVLISFKQ